MEQSTCRECGLEFKVRPSTKGIYCSLPCAAKGNAKDTAAKAKEKWDLNPNLCLECSSPIGYLQSGEHKVKRFCCSTCSALYNNRRRSPESRLKQQKTLKSTLAERPKVEREPRPKKIRKSRAQTARQPREKPIVYPSSKVFLCTCAATGLPFVSRRFRKYSSAAAREHRQTYRNYCEFKFNPFHYKEMEGYHLLLEFGLYHPLQNPQGVSRDHMLSVAEGWKLGVDPEVMKHPANCRLMLHRDNKRKYTRSSINIDELEERISKWNTT